MGSCSSDTYKMVKKQHGADFQKFIVSEQSNVHFRRIIDKRLEHFDKRVDEKKALIHQDVRKREDSMQAYFEEVKMNLDSQLPGGVASYEQMKKESIEERIGLREYQHKFQEVHAKIDRDFEEKRKDTHENFHAVANKAYHDQKLDGEKIRLYHQTTEQKRALIYDKGCKQYQKQTKEKVNSLEEDYKRDLDVESELSKFDNLIPIEHVDNLLSMARNRFRGEALSLVGGSFDSNIRW